MCLITLLHCFNVECSRRNKEFYYNFDNFYENVHGGIYFNLPLTNPFRAAVLVSILSNLVIVPACYVLLYRYTVQILYCISLIRSLIIRFTHEQNKNIVGLSENARSKRKQRNVVTMKFNMINYLLETLSLILLLTVDDYFIGDM